MAQSRARVGHWTSAAAEHEFATLYRSLQDDARELLAGEGRLPPVERRVPTRFGSTWVCHWPGTGVPLLLLNGAGAPSLMWTLLLARLPAGNVYTLDTIGDVGWSTQDAALTGRSDLGDWLDDVLDELGLDRVHLVGTSYGGWIACDYARRSSRVATLTLLEPALDKVRLWFWIHGVACLVALLLPAPVRRRVVHWLHADMLGVADKHRTRLFMLSYTKYRRGLPPLVPVDDAELMSIPVPTLVLLGDKSPVHRSRRVLARTRRLIPQVQAVMLPDAGHALPVDHADEVAAHMGVFLSSPSTAPS